MPRLKVASVCPIMKLADCESNLRTLTRWVEKAVACGADLLFFPETFITGYATEEMYKAGYARKEVFLSLAETIPGPLIGRLTELSRTSGLYICVGLLESEGEQFYNTQVVIAPDRGLAARYRKIQVGSTEAWFSRPGRDFPVFDIGGIPTAMMICRDKSFPEIARIFALEGAQLLLNPHCTLNSEHMPFPAWSLRLCIVRAMENGCYLIANNCIFDCPIETSKQAGYTFAIDPYGQVIHCSDGPSQEEKMALITVDTEVVRQRREMENRDFNLWSRSPELYQRLVRPGEARPLNAQD
jgi:predicted amidohydrolase